MRLTAHLRRTPVVVGLFALTAMALILTAEFAVRYRERHRSVVPSSTPSAFYRHRQLGIGLIRNLDYYGWFSVNRHGFRGPDFPIEKAPTETRIMVVGASTTFDTQVSADSMTWSARLEYWLRHLHPTRQIRVINAGTPGYRVLDNLIRLQTELFAFEPDIIILYHGHNDISCALADRAGRRTRTGSRPDEAATSTPWGQWLQHHSELYNKLVARWRAMVRRWAGRRAVQGTPPPILPDDRPFLCGPDQFERHVSAFLTAARWLGARVIAAPVVHVSDPNLDSEPDPALRAYWSGARPYADPDSGLALYRAYARSLQRLGTEAGAVYIETAEFALRGAELYGLRDPMHFNDLGADRMGKEMADAIQRLGLLTGDADSGQAQ